MIQPRAKKDRPATMAVPHACEYHLLYCLIANLHCSLSVAGSGFVASGGCGFDRRYRSSVIVSFVRVGLALTILSDVLGSNDKMLVESDKDILRMFEIHNIRKIKLYVDIMCSTLSQFRDVGMFLVTSSLLATSTVLTSTADCNDNISDSGDVEEYSEGIYELSSEDDDLDMNKTDCGENIGKNNSYFTIEHDDGLSDFESDDDVEYDPSTDDSSSNEEGSIGKSVARVFDQNLYGKEFNVREGSKIMLKVGQLFENVDKFRQVLQVVV
ncbi:hypothetical protein F0562_018373 [Nyssa sinensis]|uniref:Uncharacterized protein n=1 Tax=Nyssa sinensis TaxID=561372 RepID=A0A5J4ZBU6_9ASTE|nr:hypothetical protein F0562_018373 [Nyssa sinensis]